MKYIRTKDGIGVYQDNFYPDGTGEVACFRTHFVNIEDVDILKEADTIEELCDEFIITEPTHQQRHNKKYLHSAIAYMNDTAFTLIYGAIWTDTGLKYVAKMNEKGELELL